MRTQDRRFRGEARRAAVELAATKAALIAAESEANKNAQLADDAQRFATRASESGARIRIDRRDDRKYRIVFTVDADLLREAWNCGESSFVRVMAERMCHELIESYRSETMRGHCLAGERT
jgi:hypothetical protein